MTVALHPSSTMGRRALLPAPFVKRRAKFLGRKRDIQTGSRVSPRAKELLYLKVPTGTRPQNSPAGSASRSQL